MDLSWIYFLLKNRGYALRLHQARKRQSFQTFRFYEGDCQLLTECLYVIPQHMIDMIPNLIGKVPLLINGDVKVNNKAMDLLILEKEYDLIKLFNDLTTLFSQVQHLELLLVSEETDMDEIMKYIEMIYQTPASMIDTALGHIARSPSMYVGKYGQMSTDEAVTKQDFANMPVERGGHVYRDEYGDVEEIMLYYNIYLDDCYYGRLVLICDEEWKLTYLKDVLESLGPAVEKLCNRLIPSGDGSFYSPEFMFQMERFLVGDGEPDFDLLAGHVLGTGKRQWSK